MPSEQSTWLIAVPNDGDAENVVQELTFKIQQQSRSFNPKSISEFNIPSFKVCSNLGSLGLKYNMWAKLTRRPELSISLYR